MAQNFTYTLRDYTVLGAKAGLLDSSTNAMILSGLGAVDSDRAKLAAHELNREADEIDATTERWRAADSACFGQGSYGQEVAEKYIWVRHMVAERREKTARDLAERLNDSATLSNQQSYFARWKRSNNNLTSFDLGEVRISLTNISFTTLFGLPDENTNIIFEVSNMTKSKILRPKTGDVWGYELGSDLGGTRATGATVEDSFGNYYKLISVDPLLLGNEAHGIRPGETIEVKVRFGDAPLDNAKYVRIKFSPNFFGQTTGRVIQLPIEAFRAN